MPSSAALQLVHDLPGEVFLGRTLALEPVRRLSAGVTALDALLGGGWPRGKLSEINGPTSSGRTALLLALAVQATRRGEHVAYVDASDALHPESWQRAGAELRHVLWMRTPTPRDAARCAELVLQAGGFTAVVLDFGDQSPRRLQSHLWPRLARAAEGAQAAAVLSAPFRLASSFAALSLTLRPLQTRWLPGLWPLFDGLQISATIAHNKLGRPGTSTALLVT